MKNITIVILLSFILSSCIEQTPAPIEYGSTGTVSNNNDYYGSSIKEKTNVTTNWGEQKHKEESENSEYQDDQNDKDPAPVIAATQKPREDIYHEVIEGETLDSIATKYNVSKEAIISKNDLAPPYQLEELQIIIIPGESKLKIDHLVKASVAEPLPPKSIT
ncbi:MAG UNVERIFIED_CONTAM: LysM peptidoglycan-binding domain-containing protein [Rickettsiaceae bacterium]|jgi:LysM repeat protein